MLTLTEAITRRAVALMEFLTLSRGVQKCGALIAATALEHGLTMLTANINRNQCQYDRLPCRLAQYASA